MKRNVDLSKRMLFRKERWLFEVDLRLINNTYKPRKSSCQSKLSVGIAIFAILNS